MTTTTNKTNNNQGNIMNKSFILNSAIFSSTLAEETQKLIKAEEKELLTKMRKNKGMLDTWMRGSERWISFSESKVLEHALASISDVNQINFKNFKYLKSLEDYLNFVKKDGNKHSHPKINEDNVVEIIFKNANNYGTGYGIPKNTSVDVRTYINLGTERIVSRIYTISEDVTGEVYIVG